MHDRPQLFDELTWSSRQNGKVKPVHFTGQNLGKLLALIGALWLIVFAILLLCAKDRLYSIFWTPMEQMAGLVIGPLLVHTGATLRKVF